jgi:IS5 family transposase
LSGAADPVDGGALLHLKHAYNLSDEATCECWRENCYWQYSTGEVYFQTRLPCDPSPFTHWRQKLGEAGIEELLSRTVEAAKAMRDVAIKEVGRVIIDSTAQEKAIAYSTYIQLLEIARRKLVTLAL